MQRQPVAYAWTTGHGAAPIRWASPMSMPYSNLVTCSDRCYISSVEIKRVDDSMYGNPQRLGTPETMNCVARAANG